MIKDIYSYGYAKQKNKKFKQKEEQFNLKLEKDKYYIIRFDGKEMTKAFKIKGQAINVPFFNTMEATFNEFCRSNQNVLFGYSFSDEISILIRGSGDEDSDDNRIEKLLSLLTSKLTLVFYRNAQTHELDLKGKDWLFDARILEVSDSDVINYFLARQAYAIDKYVMQLKTEHNIDKDLTTVKKVLHALETKDINYMKIPAKYRYGLTYCKTIKPYSFEFDANKSTLTQMCFNN